MRLLEAENTRSYDLTIQVGAGPEWQAPMNKAITFSTALAKRLVSTYLTDIVQDLTHSQRDVKSRPKHLALVHDGITPWMMDAMVHHWIFGDYDFDISKGRKGETLLSLREGTTKGPYATDGLTMAHMQVYLGAKLLGDEILSQTALGKFMAVLSQNKDVKTLISLVKIAFATGFAKHDGEFSVRSLLVTHTYVWDKVWLSEESREYVRLKKETPAFAQMLKEAYSGAGGKLQK